MSNIGIYKISHIPTGICYIGSSRNLKQRLHDHERHLIKNKHVNKKLQDFWNINNPNDFIFEVVEECSIDQLELAEQKHIDSYNFSQLLNNNKIAHNVVSRFPQGTKSNVNDFLKLLNKKNPDMFSRDQIKGFFRKKDEFFIIDADYIKGLGAGGMFFVDLVKDIVINLKNRTKTPKYYIRELELNGINHLKSYIVSVIYYVAKYEIKQSCP